MQRKFIHHPKGCYLSFLYFCNPWPDGICFDHDLGEGSSGYDAAKYIIDRCMDDDLPLPLFWSQSSNPGGKENIIKLLTNFGNTYNKR